VHGSKKVFVEHVLIVAGVQFRTRPNSRAFSTAGSVMTSADLSKNRCSHSKNQFDESFRRLQNLDVIQAEAPITFSAPHSKRLCKLCSKGKCVLISNGKRIKECKKVVIHDLLNCYHFLVIINHGV